MVELESTWEERAYCAQVHSERSKVPVSNGSLEVKTLDSRTPEAQAKTEQYRTDGRCRQEARTSETWTLGLRFCASASTTQTPPTGLQSNSMQHDLFCHRLV